MLARQWWQVEGLAALACECQAQFAERRLEIGELGSTVHAKARVIEVPLGTRPLDPRWTLPSFAERIRQATKVTVGIVAAARWHGRSTGTRTCGGIDFTAA